MKTISFRKDMIDLILSGKKTLTIRPIKPQPVRVEVTGLFGTTHYEWNGRQLAGMRDWFMRHCQYGVAGDIISVQENDNLLIKITSIGLGRVDQLTISEWAADGVKEAQSQRYREKYEEGGFMYDAPWYHWQSFYRGTDYDWKNKPFVWVIRFEVQP